MCAFFFTKYLNFIPKKKYLFYNYRADRKKGMMGGGLAEKGLLELHPSAKGPQKAGAQ